VKVVFYLSIPARAIHDAQALADCQQDARERRDGDFDGAARSITTKPREAAHRFSDFALRDRRRIVASRAALLFFHRERMREKTMMTPTATRPTITHFPALNTLPTA
jgi:hypothetical protein